MTITIKVSHNGHTRKLTQPESPSWEVLSKKVADMYRIPASDLALSYVDAENDQVTLSTQEELQDYFTHFLRDGETARFTVQAVTSPPVIQAVEQEEPKVVVLAEDEAEPDADAEGDEWDKVEDEIYNPPIQMSEALHTAAQDVLGLDPAWDGGPILVPGVYDPMTLLGAVEAARRNPELLPELQRVSHLSPRSTATLIQMLDSESDSDQDIHPSANKGKGRDPLAGFGTFGQVPDISVYPPQHVLDADDPPLPTLTSPILEPTPPANAAARVVAQGTSPNIVSDVTTFLQTITTAFATHPELSEGVRTIIRNATNGAYAAAERDAAIAQANVALQNANNAVRAAANETTRGVSQALQGVFQALNLDLTTPAPQSRNLPRDPAESSDSGPPGLEAIWHNARRAPSPAHSHRSRRTDGTRHSRRHRDTSYPRHNHEDHHHWPPHPPGPPGPGPHSPPAPPPPHASHRSGRPSRNDRQDVRYGYGPQPFFGYYPFVGGPRGSGLPPPVPDQRDTPRAPFMPHFGYTPFAPVYPWGGHAPHSDEELSDPPVGGIRPPTAALSGGPIPVAPVPVAPATTIIVQQPPPPPAVQSRDDALRELSARKTKLEIAKEQYKEEKRKWREEKDRRRQERDQEIERITGRRVHSRERRRLDRENEGSERVQSGQGRAQYEQGKIQAEQRAHGEILQSAADEKRALAAAEKAAEQAPLTRPVTMTEPPPYVGTRTPRGRASHAAQAERLIDRLEDMGFTPSTHPRLNDIVREKTQENTDGQFDDEDVMARIMEAIVNLEPSTSTAHNRARSPPSIEPW